MPFFSQGGSTVSSSNIVDGTIVNADINAAAGIVASKLGGGVFKKLTDDTLGAPAASMTTTTFAGVSLLKVMIVLPSSPSEALRIRFNGDSGANYDGQDNENGVASGGGSGTTLGVIEGAGVGVAKVCILDIWNIAALPKHAIFDFGAGGRKGDGWVRWNNTSAAITAITVLLHAGGNLPTGTRIVVYGCDLT